MKIISIKQADSNNFRGLWEQPKEKVTNNELYYIYRHVNNTYHPFATESEEAIKKEMATRTFNINIPVTDLLKVESIQSETELGKKLSFTLEEFNNYKAFYGKNLPEHMKKIEAELLGNNLAHFKNKGIIYKIKKILYCLMSI